MDYRICGLAVSSEIALPLDQVATPGGKADVTVRRGAVPQVLERRDYSGPNWQIGDQRFIVTVPGAVRLLVEDGVRITADLMPGIPDADIAPFILSTAFAALLHQRRTLALHASTIAFNGLAVSLSGPSGTGKSTLAAVLCKDGYDLVGDDVAAIRIQSGCAPLVAPDGRRHRLWSDAISHLEMSAQQEAPVRNHLTKYHVRTQRPSELNADHLPLAAVILLKTRDARHAATPPRIERLTPVDAASLLREEVYRPRLATHMGTDASLFMQVAAVLETVPVYRLERTRGFEYLDAAASLVRSVTAQA